MSNAKEFYIKESEKQIRQFMSKSNPMIAKRLRVLLMFKQHGTAISKRVGADLTGFNQNSVQAWRTMYIQGGIEALMCHQKTGFKSSVINKLQEQELGRHLHKADNGMVGFVELLHWFNERFNTQVNYKTFHGFVVRKFQAKIKTARKSHVNKDALAVRAFKKTSHKPAGKLSGKSNPAIKK